MTNDPVTISGEFIYQPDAHSPYFCHQDLGWHTHDPETLRFWSQWLSEAASIFQVIRQVVGTDEAEKP